MMDVSNISLETAAAAAKELWTVANKLGEMVNLADDMARFGWSAIEQEMKAYEVLHENGLETIKALRILATRLDRSVVSMGGEQ